MVFAFARPPADMVVFVNRRVSDIAHDGLSFFHGMTWGLDAGQTAGESPGGGGNRGPVSSQALGSGDELTS